MKRSLLLVPLTAVALTLGLAPAAAVTTGPGRSSTAPAVVHGVVETPGEVIPGRYIVTVADGADPRRLARALNVSPRAVYAAVVEGFAADLTPAQLRTLQRSPHVARIEEDATVAAARAAAAPIGALAAQRVTSTSGLWGLDRIDQRSLPLSGGYSYATTARNVNAYVIDTGIATGHPDFGGRARNVYDAFGGDGQDCNGHGTHVAGTIGGATYGVAKDVQLRGLRVLGCSGTGSTSGIIAAVDWLRTHHVKPAVANLSLGGSYSPTLNTAVASLAAAGVSVAVAAGNENQDACSVSPASASNVVTVAASDRTDTRASFSNHGSCVETYAPGVAVASTWLDGGSRTISGTSMASPHVAGAMALYKAAYGDASSATVNSAVVKNATARVVKGNPTGTPNRLLFKASL